MWWLMMRMRHLGVGRGMFIKSHFLQFWFVVQIEVRLSSALLKIPGYSLKSEPPPEGTPPPRGSHRARGWLNATCDQIRLGPSFLVEERGV